MHADIRLTPGVAVLPVVLGEIDSNGDGVISDAEQRAYAEKVVSDLSFAVDGKRIEPRLMSMRFPAMAEMKEGLGEIHLEVEADFGGGGSEHRLTFENHHEFSIAAYLVNCVVPRDPNIRIVAQKRNYGQSSYELDFTGSRAAWAAISAPGGAGVLLLLAGATRLLLKMRQKT